MKHTPPTTEPIVFECDLPQAPALVWRALTERDLLGAWLLPNDLQPEVGARFSFAGAGQQSSERIDCEVLEVEPNRTLRWRQTEDGTAISGWRPVTSVVTIELRDSDDGGTHLRLVHGEFTMAAATVIPFRARAQARKPADLAQVRKPADIVCRLRRAA